ncbi:MAG: zinc-ribbon domain-containing protein [Candidatus Bathyarchaeia archaeon]
MSNCGQDVTDDMRFCPRCLAPLKTTAVPASVVTLSDPYLVGTRQTPFLTVSAFLVEAAAFYVCWIFGSVHHLPIIPAWASPL